MFTKIENGARGMTITGIGIFGIVGESNLLFFLSPFFFSRIKITCSGLCSPLHTYMLLCFLLCIKV